MMIKAPANEHIEKQIDKLKDEFVEIEQTASELIKKGLETEIVDLMLMDVPSKFKMTAFSQDQHDVDGLKKFLGSLKEEISQLQTGSDFDRIAALIEEAFEHLRKAEKTNAHEKYREIVELYRLLPHDLKKTVFQSCLELQKRLS